MSQATLAGMDIMQSDIDALMNLDDDVLSDVDKAWPQTLADMVDILRATALDRGKSETEAMLEARRTIMVLAHYFGGQVIYLPRNEKLRLALRNQQIWYEFKGRNIQALAKKHKLTETMIYGILKEQRKQMIMQKQRSMFPSAAPVKKG